VFSIPVGNCVPIFADDGSKKRRINYRFGRNGTYIIPEYNYFFEIVYIRNIATGFFNEAIPS
jgi:hypothetical protein